MSGNNHKNTQTTNLRKISSINIKIQFLTFLYFRYLFFLLNKLKLYKNNRKVIALFIDVSHQTSFLVREICLKYNHYFLINKWLYGYITNFVQVLNTLSLKLKTQDTFSYRYFLPRKIPDIFFIINPLKQSNIMEKELMILHCPVIYCMSLVTYNNTAKLPYYLTFFANTNIHFLFYVTFFNKLLKIFKI